MASVPWQGMPRQHKEARILDLDEGSTPPQWLQVVVGLLIIAVFIALVSLWQRPVTPPNLILDARPSASVLTVPAIRSLAPDSFTPSASTFGPQVLRQGATNTVAFAGDGT